MPILNREELDDVHMLTLFAVNRAPDGVPTKIHFQIMMYLILEAMGNDPEATVWYSPSRFGPHSYIVEGWRDCLVENGWLAKNTKERITIPENLKETVSRISFPDSVLTAKVDSIVRFVCSLTRTEVLLYVYADNAIEGEGMTEDSDVKKDIIGKRVRLALSMARRDKVSAAKGAELADMDAGSFMKLLGGEKSRRPSCRSM